MFIPLTFDNGRECSTVMQVFKLTSLFAIMLENMIDIIEYMIKKHSTSEGVG